MVDVGEDAKVPAAQCAHWPGFRRTQRKELTIPSPVSSEMNVTVSSPASVGRPGARLRRRPLATRPVVSPPASSTNLVAARSKETLSPTVGSPATAGGGPGPPQAQPDRAPPCAHVPSCLLRTRHHAVHAASLDQTTAHHIRCQRGGMSALGCRARCTPVPMARRAIQGPLARHSRR